ncbi:MAG: hypothetical protein RR237_05260 [Acetivibrio sp.]
MRLSKIQYHYNTMIGKILLKNILNFHGLCQNKRNGIIFVEQENQREKRLLPGVLMKNQVDTAKPYKTGAANNGNFFIANGI